MNSKWHSKSQVKCVKTILTIDFDNMEIINDINKSNYTLRGVRQEIMEREEVVSGSGDNFSKGFMLREQTNGIKQGIFFILIHINA